MTLKKKAFVCLFFLIIGDPAALVLDYIIGAQQAHYSVLHQPGGGGDG